LVAALLAFAMSATLLMAGGLLLFGALSTHPPIQRYRAAAAVVAGDQRTGADHDVVLETRVRIDSALLPALRAVPGVQAAIADIGLPALLGNRATEVHNWGSAALAPYLLTGGRAPRGANEVVTGFPAKLGSRLLLTSTGSAHSVSVVGVAIPRHAVDAKVAFVADEEASRLAGHPGRVDAIGILSDGHLDMKALGIAAHGALVLTGEARGNAEEPEQQAGRSRLIAVAASFGGVGAFISLFVLAGIMALSVQQREREIGLLRAVGATPRQVRRMITWEATLLAMTGAVAGLWPGLRLGRWLAAGIVRHGIAPVGFETAHADIATAGVLGVSLITALASVFAASRRAARTSPTRALSAVSVEPTSIGRGRLIGGIVALAGAAPLFLVSAATTTPATAAATSELDAIFLVIAAGCLGPLVAKFAAAVFRPLLGRVAPVGAFLAVANLSTATRRFSSATTPLVLTVAMSSTLLFSTTTFDHAISQQRDAGISSDVAMWSQGAGIPPSLLPDVRRTSGVVSAVALTPTTLAPSLDVSDDVIPASVLDGGAGGGLDVGVTAGSLTHLRGDTIALSSQRADGAHASVGSTVSVRLADGMHASAMVVAIYSRSLAFGDALLAPELVAGHVASPLLGTVLVQARNAGAVTSRLRAVAAHYPGVAVGTVAVLRSADDADREANRWLGPLFVTIIFLYTSLAVVNTLVMIAARRRRELAILRLAGATKRQVRSMAWWETIMILVIGVGVGLLITAAALLPLSHALTGQLRPYIPPRDLAAIVAVSAGLAAAALLLPTRRALRKPAVAGLGFAD
jgi:putative ABC transport system permease protein